MARYSEWCAELERELAEPFDANLIQTKRKGGTDIAFVAWHHYVRKLNQLCGPGWSMGEPVTRDLGQGEGAKLLVGLPVTIFGVTRINFGTEDEDKDDYGDAATNAWAQAFKRTCALFGMGLDMYLKGKPARAAAKPAPRPAANGKASNAELQEIAKLAEERQVSAVEWEKLSKALAEGMTAEFAAKTLKWLRALPKLEGATK